MTSIKQKVLDFSGKEVGTVELNGDVFGSAPRDAEVHEVVCWQLASRRSGTHATLTKGEMNWGKKKPWKQKGTGRARAGSSTSPIWVGGGVAHGPQPRDYSYRLPKRTRRNALAAVISDKCRNEKLLVLESFELKSGKTKDMESSLKKLGLAGSKTLVILPNVELNDGQKMGVRAARNIGSITLRSVDGLNVYDIVSHENLVLSRDSIAVIEQKVSPKKSAQ